MISLGMNLSSNQILHVSDEENGSEKWNSMTENGVHGLPSS